MKLAAIGNYDSIYGYRSIGADIVSVDDLVSAKNELARIIDLDYGAVFITEQLASNEDIYEIMKSVTVPAFLVIPSSDRFGQDRGFAIQELHNLVETAAGADIL